ncbi:MAG: hypothetical protein Q4E34_06535 [Synergistaceae bacterium]|nr:hypothetical protein [Synergistaceae bacterium]
MEQAARILPQNIQTVTPQEEAKEKWDIVHWLQELTGGRGEIEIINALKSDYTRRYAPIGSLRWAYKHRKCTSDYAFFDCPCNGEPMTKCKGHGWYGAVAWESDPETGMILGFHVGAAKCERYAERLKEIAERKAADLRQALDDDRDEMF